MNGGNGTDLASYEYATAAVNASLANNGLTAGQALGDVFTDIENLDGSVYADNLYGSTLGNVIRGLNGVDAIYGYAGNDSLYGGDGDDGLVGGDGADVIDGGNGFDTLYYNSSTVAVSINLTTGTNSGGEAAGDTISNIDAILGSAYNDTMVGDGGYNYFSGGAGNDSLSTGDGNDGLYGGLGADTLNGGNGTDIIDFSSATSAVTVNMNGGVGTGGEANGDVYISIENFYGSNYADTVTGGSDDNAIYGLGGNDFLYGYLGNDILTGGAGVDTFFFHNDEGADTIMDFEGAGVAGGDLIQLYQSGYANFTALQSAISYADGNATITFSAGNAITVLGVTSFTASDFSFV